LGHIIKNSRIENLVLANLTARKRQKDQIAGAVALLTTYLTSWRNGSSNRHATTTSSKQEQNERCPDMIANAQIRHDNRRRRGRWRERPRQTTLSI